MTKLRLTIGTLAGLKRNTQGWDNDRSRSSVRFGRLLFVLTSCCHFAFTRGAPGQGLCALRVTQDCGPDHLGRLKFTPGWASFAVCLGLLPSQNIRELGCCSARNGHPEAEAVSLFDGYVTAYA
ncbi:hypothetical protein K443DRAFT_123205 [Laccaria amethystina LaAM-08-1]|uniref:Uncharacterized protein n=1 Tax=Laccaria amethystina LaAM-08-1 TaxID=1095629 RepID=A0A0C9WP02_9AGAR|nr:hypothetical protein K443DRAFT_123205 [Laccaria amethystina LaAM-08-1]